VRNGFPNRARGERAKARGPGEKKEKVEEGPSGQVVPPDPSQAKSTSTTNKLSEKKERREKKDTLDGDRFTCL